MMSESGHDALIFDLDGTLWNTVPACAEAWNRAVLLEGLSYRRITEEDVRGGMGLAADDLRARVFPDLPRELGARLLKSCFDQEIVELDRRGAQFFPGVREGVARLAAGRALYIVSNCDGPYLEAFFRVSGLRAHFRDAECHGNTGLTKGENLRLLLRRNGLASAVYVGDTAGDQKAAAVAGIPFVFARYGFGECTGWERAIDSFDELERELARDL
jgi:phosphoglycolate phosphatase